MVRVVDGLITYRPRSKSMSSGPLCPLVSTEAAGCAALLSYQYEGKSCEYKSFVAD